MNFEPYFAELFSNLPESEASNTIKEKILQETQSVYENNLQQGMAEEEAVRHALLAFGSRQGLESRILDQQVEKNYQLFLDNYPSLVRWGFAAVLVLPLLFLVLMFSLESKLVFLVLWIISLFSLAAFLVIIDYTRYRYQQLMKSRSEQRIAWLNGKIMDQLQKSIKREKRHLRRLAKHKHE